MALVGKTTKVSSLADARRLIASLVTQQGYDIFRGQLNGWDPLPTILRANSSVASQKRKSLPEFLDWAANTPGLQEYCETDPYVGKAIAQHYGIPTSLLDITRSLEVALYLSLIHI